MFSMQLFSFFFQVAFSLSQKTHRCCSEVSAGAHPDAAKAFVAPSAALLRRCFAAEAAAEEVVERLAAERASPVAEKLLKSLKSKSPLSVTWEEILEDFGRFLVFLFGF